MAVVVSDTSPLRALALLGRMDLLELLFRKVLIPPAVEAELGRYGRRFSVVDVTSLAYIRVQAPGDVARVQELQRLLDPGESEAIALALEINAEAILIDESAGRAIAHRLGLTPIGVLGVLLRSKRRGYVDLVKPLIERLETELGFVVGTELRTEVLRGAGEA